MEITNLIRKGLQLGVGFSMFIGSMATLSLIPGVGGIFSSIGTTLYLDYTVLQSLADF